MSVRVPMSFLVPRSGVGRIPVRGIQISHPGFQRTPLRVTDDTSHCIALCCITLHDLHYTSRQHTTLYEIALRAYTPHHAIHPSMLTYPFLHTHRHTIHTHTYIHTYRQTDRQTYRHTDIHTRTHTYIHSCMHPCVPCIPTYVLGHTLHTRCALRCTHTSNTSRCQKLLRTRAPGVPEHQHHQPQTPRWGSGH